jgi:hypothetical protein
MKKRILNEMSKNNTNNFGRAKPPKPPPRYANAWVIPIYE